MVQYILLCLFLTSPSYGNHIVAVQDVPALIERQLPKASQYLRQNISPEGTALGVVVASPSKSYPDYFYHWVRDAALVMNAVQDRIERPLKPWQQWFDEKLMFEFATFSRSNQLTETLSPGLGEPKFYVDGRGYDEPWGRPQNDGPALRAITMIRFAKHLLKDPLNRNYVRTFLYDSKLPTQSLIKADLEFVAHYWQKPSFDLWEEVMADHFYTHMVQRAALVHGAQFAELMGDGVAADFYRGQAAKLEVRLLKYWNGRILQASQNRRDGVDYKTSNLDLAVVLGVLHGDTGDGFLSVSSPEVVATVARLEEAFSSLYSINRNGQVGIGIGRYPEDRYDGLSTSTMGNPWFLGNHAFAEYYYKLSKAWKIEGVKQSIFQWRQFSQRALRKGDEYLARAFYHMNQDTGSMAEQFNRSNGYMQGARDLTWSYASFLTAARAREIYFE